MNDRDDSIRKNADKLHLLCQAFVTFASQKTRSVALAEEVLESIDGESWREIAEKAVSDANL